MTREEFENLVAEALDSIPEKSYEKIKNVAVIIEETPSGETLRKYKIKRGWTLFGVYEGIPLTDRTTHYGVGETFPDRIVIFRKPIEQAAGGRPEKIKKIVHNTVAHEVAHHFGMDEHAVLNWERQKRIERK